MSRSSVARRVGRRRPIAFDLDSEPEFAAKPIVQFWPPTVLSLGGPKAGLQSEAMPFLSVHAAGRQPWPTGGSAASCGITKVLSAVWNRATACVPGRITNAPIQRL